MDLIENWTRIFEHHDEVAIFPFLKELNATQKKDLLLTISKAAKAYLVLKDRLINGKHFYTKKASLKQERILNYSLLVTIPNRQHVSCQWLNINVIATDVVAEKILSWYCPHWFSDYFNELEQLDFMSLPITYNLVMEMTQKKYIQPSELLISKLLVQLIYFKLPNQRWTYQFQPQNLVIKTYTLKKHFWYLFKYPTQIYSCERLLLLTDDAQQEGNKWYIAIKKYVDEGKIDRIKLLKASLSATNNPIFNKLAIGWFIGLFNFIKPQETELLAVQTALFQTYKLAYSKATNTALAAIQKIVHLPDFQVEKSLINFEVLVMSKTKSIVFNAFSVLEKIANNHPEKQNILCEIAAKGFVNRTAAIQNKAATFIQKYGAGHQQKLKTIIFPNKTNLLHSTQTILVDIFGKGIEEVVLKNVDTEFVEKEEVKLLNEANKIPLINNFDAFINLALQVFDNKAPYHFDQFITNILVFQKEIKGENIERLMPLFRRSYQLVFNELPSRHGMLDNMLATFLLDFSDLLIGRYPNHSQGLQALTTSYLEQGFYLNDQSVPFDLNNTHLSRWYNPYDPSLVYTPIKLLLEAILMLLQQQVIRPVLSMPTHSSSWIAPIDLVERLVFYQENKIVPHRIDLQIAISRMAFEAQAAALKYANKKLKGRYLELMTYLLSEGMESTKPFEKSITESYELLVAAITKNSRKAIDELEPLPSMDLPETIFTGNHKWMIFWEERQMEAWNHKTQRDEFVGAPFIHRELQVKTPRGIHFEAHPDFLYQYFPGNGEAFRPNINDIKRLLGLLPNNPSPLIVLLVADNLKYATFLDVIAKRRVTAMIDWLAKQSHLTYTPPMHLFLATAMLCADKNISIKASEIWQNTVSRNQLNASILGTILGRLENKEFAPLKRFIDLAQDHLLNISSVHNKALEKMIANLLGKLPPIPIKHTKQLLILYRELLASNHSSIKNERLLILFLLWEESPSLRKVLKTLTEFVA